MRTLFRTALRRAAPALAAAIFLLLPAPSARTQDLPSFYGPAEEDGGSRPAAVWSGGVSARVRGFTDTQSPADGAAEAWTRMNLDLRYAGEKTELFIKLLYDGYRGTDQEMRKLVDEAWLRAYLGRVDLEAGLMKVVWGRGDELHVVDVLNPTDYTDFVNNEYLERRPAQLMFRLVGRVGDASNLELVYQPRLTPDTIPREGPWKPYEVRALEDALAAQAPALITQLTTYYTTILGVPDPATAAVLAAARAEQIYADPLSEDVPATIADGTWGARWTGSFGGLDLGLLYAWTFHRRPSVDATHFLADGKVYLTYDRMHVFGIEAASVLAGFNLRGEAGYFLTEDPKGKDPRVRNSQAGYAAGFDRDILPDGPNLNVQVRGLLTLGSGGIEDNGAADTDYRANYTDHVLAVRISDAWNRGRIKPQVSFLLGLENRDLRISPEISWEPADDLRIRLRYVRCEGGRDTNFGQFRDSDFAEAGVSLRF